MDGHQTFLERAQFEVTKNLYYVLSQGEPKKGISSWTMTKKIPH